MVVLGVQVVLTPAAGLEMVTVTVVLEEQLAATPADGVIWSIWLTDFSVGTAAAAEDCPATAEVGTAFLVEGVALSTGAASVDRAGTDTLDTTGTVSLDRGA